MRADPLVEHNMDCAILPAGACQTSIDEAAVLGH